jgi:sec-independent protein translocase protein TatA
MGDISPIHILLALLIIVLLFGGKKIPEMMRGLGQGVREFKEGMRETPAPPAPPAETHTTSQTAQEKK